MKALYICSMDVSMLYNFVCDWMVILCRKKSPLFGCQLAILKTFIGLAAILEVEFWVILDQQNHHFQAVCVWY